MRKFSLLAILFLFGFLLVGCGGGGDSSDDDPQNTTPQQTTVPTGTTEEERPEGFHFIFTVNVPETTESDAEIFMVGSFNDWTYGDDDFKLEKVSNTQYTIDQVIPYDGKLSKTIEFKFVKGDSVDYVEKRASGADIENRPFNLMKGYTGSDTFTVAAWGAPVALTSYDFTIEVTVPSDTPTDANIYLVGTMTETEWEHANADWKLTKVSDTLYKIEKSIPYGDEDDSFSFEYKVVLGNSWDSVEKNTDGSELSDNRSFTMAKNAEAKTDEITVAKWALIPTDDTTQD